MTEAQRIALAYMDSRMWVIAQNVGRAIYEAGAALCDQEAALRQLRAKVPLPGDDLVGYGTSPQLHKAVTATGLAASIRALAGNQPTQDDCKE